MEKKIIKRNISIIGSRGIPNNYGGFEKFTEVLSKSLVQRGFPVIVSCEKSRNKEILKDYFGVKLFYFPLNPPKSGGSRIIYEFVYDVYSLYFASKRSEFVYMLGYSAAFLFFIPKLFGKKLWVNPDGIEWKRSKFNLVIKFLLKLSEKMTVFWADEIIVDSREIKEYLDNQYNINTKYISYGTQEFPEQKWNEEKLPNNIKYNNIQKERYWLLVARLEPENNIQLIIEAYTKSNVEKPLIVIGNFSSHHYEAIIRNMIKGFENKVIFLGGIYNQDLLNMLRQNCFAYIHGHSVGGTNPSLLEIMAMKTVIIAHGNPYNREVCGDSAIYFEDAEILDKIEMVDSNIEYFFELRDKAYERILKDYSWNLVVEQYENFIKGEN